jgi:hypothetical protein
MSQGYARGIPGLNAGVRYTYSTDTANSDPGSGFLKFDNTTLSSATVLRISETSADADAVGPWIATWDDSTSTVFGTVHMFKDTNPQSIFFIFQIASTITDHGAWDSFTITPIATGGSFVNGDSVRIAFYPTGDKGTTGTTGATGAAGFPAPFHKLQYFSPDYDTTSIVDTIGNAAPTESGTKTKVDDSTGEYTNYATNTSAGNVSGLTFSSLTRFQGGPIVWTRIKTPTSLTNTRLWLLAIARSDPGTSDTMATGGIGFRFSPTTAGDAQLILFHSTEGGVSTAENTGVTLVADTPYELEIDASTPTNILCYVNGTLTNTITTNLPGTTNLYNGYVESACVTGGTATSIRWTVFLCQNH